MAVGRLGDQTDILRDDQIVRPVPASSIHLHDNEIRGKDALTSSRKRFIMAVEASGKISETIWPRTGVTAA